MARPLRIEFAGALYHVTTRGNARMAIHENDGDRQQFLSLLKVVVDRYDWHCHAYCLMDNHYHLLIETGRASLSDGMKLLNGTYTQYYNRQHHRTGHVFQGRFKAILVQKQTYLLELARYIVLNPVRAQMVPGANDWRWSSYRATAGLEEGAACLTTDWILSVFAKSKKVAQQRYRAFVQQGGRQPSPWQSLKNQIYLGDEEFILAMQSKINAGQSLEDIPKIQQRQPKKPLDHFEQSGTTRAESMAQAYLSGHYTLAEVGQHFGVSYATVSRAVKQREGRLASIIRPAP